MQGKLVTACRAIVWEGQELDQAAKAAGLTTRSVRLALQRSHVIQWMKAEREVFRAYIASQNIHYAREMRENSENEMAKLGAMKLIEAIGGDEPSAGVRAQAPGFVVYVQTHGETKIAAGPVILPAREPDPVEDPTS